jgi:hypothetical protein
MTVRCRRSAVAGRRSGDALGPEAGPAPAAASAEAPASSAIRVHEPAAMADRGDSHFAQIVGGQGRQNGAIDGVLAKRGLVLLKTEGAEPRDEVERGAWTGGRRS